MNDKDAVAPSRSISHERWQEAQRWERDVWRNEWRRSFRSRLRRVVTVTRLGKVLPGVATRLGEGDDWNKWWCDQFDGYAALPERLGHLLELGCGPYTNTRLILQGRQVGHVECSDPLASEYIRMRGCWLAEANRVGLVNVDDHPAEECPYASDLFDATVMINVLDHVRDMRLCVEQAIRVTRPGGSLVIGQDLTDAEDEERIGVDVGHPIRITHQELDGILGKRFKPVTRRVLGRSEGRNPEAHYGTYLFIGTKR